MSHTEVPGRPLRRLLQLLWQQPLWALGFALFFGTVFGAKPESYVLAYKLSLVFAYSIGLALWATTHFLVPRIPSRPPGDTRDPKLIGLAYGASSLIASFAAAFAVHFTLLPGFMGDARSIATTGLYTLLFITLFGGIRFAVAFHRQAVARARMVEQVRAELAQAELRALRAQIHPHFLFNTLNSIASLIATQPAAAEDVTTRLADLFRYALRASEREHAPLGEELAFLRGYLEIERVRFGDRLRVEEAFEPGLERLPVPTLLLQPLVENAVRHGVAPRPEGGTVRLSGRREGGTLVLEVADDGPGLDGASPSSGTGFGLHAVRERLRAAGLPDALALDSTPDGGTRARVVLPLDASPGPRSKEDTP